MPQIIIKGVASEDIKNMSKELVSDLAVICDTTEDNFIFEEVNDSYYSYGEKTKMYPLVEIKMFDRGSDVEKSMYFSIRNYLESKDYEDIEVYFIHLKNSSYFY